jgi:hypothetical protein
MPDDPEQQDGSPGLLTTAGQLAGIAREALVANTGQANLAGIVREALLAGVGLAGRIGAQSSAQGSVTTTFMGVVFGGRIATTARARASAILSLNLAGRISAKSRGSCFVLNSVTIGGRITTKASAVLLRVGQLPIQGRIKAQSAGRGLVNLNAVGLQRQWATVINTG